MPTIINQDAEKRTYKQGEYTNTGLDKAPIVKRALALERELSSWIPTFKDLSDYEYPTIGFFYTPTPNQGSKINHTLLIDSEATDAVDIMASGMLSGLTSPSRPWFKLGLENSDDEALPPVKGWLERSTNRLLSIFPGAGIYAMLKNIYKELAVFATACGYLEENFERVMLGRNYTAGEYAVCVNSKGEVDTFYRKRWMQVSQMVEEFGLENCSEEVQGVYNGNRPDEWRIVHHLIEPNNDRIPFLKDYKNMPFRSIYWEDKSKDNTSYLRIGGYEEFPMVAPRWETTTSSDNYGKGPGWKALGHVKMLQALQKNKLIALDKQTNPPLQTDASVTGEVNTLPGGITRTSATHPNAGVRTTYEVNLNLAELDQTISTTKEEIRRKFFTNLFLMMLESERQGREITATEIIEKQQERMSVLAPILEQLETSLLNPLIERAYNIADRAGLIEPPPPELYGKNIKIKYISVLAQAQRMIDVSIVDQFVQGVLLDTQINPSSIDIINFDKKNRFKADVMGVPERVLNTPEEVAQLRQEREAAAEAMERRENMIAGADATAKAGKGAKDLSETEMGKGSMLDRISDSMAKAQK